MDKDVENLLDAIVILVDRDDMRWTAKRDAILAARKESDACDTAVDEFLSWFEKGATE